MSGNDESRIPFEPVPRAASHRKRSSRAEASRDYLGEALVRLMQEKPFDSITVQEVLDRAGVSRTTFYTHFRDKQDLFLSDVEDFMESAATMLTRSGAPEDRIAPVEELFSHVAEVQEFYRSLLKTGKADEVRELGIGHFAKSIEQRLKQTRIELTETETRASSHTLAGALFSLLDWWICHKTMLSPREMDLLFHRMVWRGLGPSPR